MEINLQFQAFDWRHSEEVTIQYSYTKCVSYLSNSSFHFPVTCSNGVLPPGSPATHVPQPTLVKGPSGPASPILVSHVLGVDLATPLFTRGLSASKRSRAPKSHLSSTSGTSLQQASASTEFPARSFNTRGCKVHQWLCLLSPTKKSTAGSSNVYAHKDTFA